jgi:hypothetical protein
MEREPNLIISSASQRIVEDGVPFKIDIYKLEGCNPGRNIDRLG